MPTGVTLARNHTIATAHKLQQLLGAQQDQAVIAITQAVFRMLAMWTVLEAVATAPNMLGGLSG